MGSTCRQTTDGACWSSTDDDETRHDSGPDEPPGETAGLLPVHQVCKEPSSPGYARPGCGCRGHASAICTDPRSGATDCHHAGRCSTTGAEADAGRETVPADPEDVPRHGWQDHWH